MKHFKHLDNKQIKKPKKKQMEKIKFYAKTLIFKIMNWNRFEIVNRVILETGLICIHTKDKFNNVITIHTEKNELI